MHWRALYHTSEIPDEIYIIGRQYEVSLCNVCISLVTFVLAVCILHGALEAKVVFQQSAMFVERKFETDDRLFDLRLFSNSNYLINKSVLDKPVISMLCVVLLLSLA